MGFYSAVLEGLKVATSSTTSSREVKEGAENYFLFIFQFSCQVATYATIFDTRASNYLETEGLQIDVANIK